MKAAAGSCFPDSENPTWAPGGEGGGLPQQEGYWQHLASRRGFPWDEGTYRWSVRRGTRQLFSGDKFRARQTRDLEGARRGSGTPGPGLAPGLPGGCWLSLYGTVASGPVRSPKALTGPCGASGAASREVTESRRGGGGLGTRRNLAEPACLSHSGSARLLCLPPLSALLAGDPHRFQ